MTDLETKKALASDRATDEVENGMLISLRTGSTKAYVIRECGEHVTKDLKIKAVETSLTSEALAQSLGIEGLSGSGVARVSLAIDGADEIDLMRNAINGGSSALLGEKIVAASVDRGVVIVDSSKAVERLGRFKLPLELLLFAFAWVVRSLKEFGVQFNMIADINSLAVALDKIFGVVERGLLLTEVDLAMIGRNDQVEIH